MPPSALLKLGGMNLHWKASPILALRRVSKVNLSFAAMRLLKRLIDAFVQTVVENARVHSEQFFPKPNPDRRRPVG